MHPMNITDTYNKVLLATDLGPQSIYIGERAKALCQCLQAELFILHVIECPLSYFAQFSAMEKTLSKMKIHAEKSLRALCVELEIPTHYQILRQGSPQNEIIHLAQTEEFRLLVLGSHGVGGYAHAFGSTAHNLLTHASCDVLTVQVSHLQPIISRTLPEENDFLWKPFVRFSSSLQQTKEQKEPKFSSSRHGFGENIQRGPRLTPRPPHAPYQGNASSERTKKERDEPHQDNEKS